MQKDSQDDDGASRTGGQAAAEGADPGRLRPGLEREPQFRQPEQGPKPTWDNPPPFTSSPAPSWREIHAAALRASPEPVRIEPSFEPPREEQMDRQPAAVPPVPPQGSAPPPLPHSLRQDPVPPPSTPPQPPPWRPTLNEPSPGRVTSSFDAEPSPQPIGYGSATSVEAPSQGWDRLKERARTAGRYMLYALGAYFAFVFVLILLYRFVNPPASALMVVQAATGTEVHQEWVPLERISPSLIRAVIVSEDWAFCEHYGIDIKAIEQAIEKSGNGFPRGASTISMQLTKNLFLWNAKSYVRKAIELPLTLMVELIWPKWRILEVYLNVAEWGPGVFGAEAAAQYHFGKSAARLSDREAAQLAASLPNPMIRDAGDPGPQTARKANVVQSRMRNAGEAARCVLGPRRDALEN